MREYSGGCNCNTWESSLRPNLSSNKRLSSVYIEVSCQEDGYTTTESWASYNGTIKVRVVLVEPRPVPFIIMTSSGGSGLLHGLSETTIVLWETPGLHLLIRIRVKSGKTVSPLETFYLLFSPSEAERRELYSEYHLGRQAWRLCKRGTKYCGWHREMPEFYEWRHMCLTYDGFKDLYKVFVDGVKIESGSWTGDRTFEGVRSGLTLSMKTEW